MLKAAVLSKIDNLDAKTLLQYIKDYIKNNKGIDEQTLEAMFVKIKNLGINTYEVLCEIERVLTYDELAHIFSSITDIPYTKDIYGEITEVNIRYIKTLLNGKLLYYIWHPLTIKSYNFSNGEVYIIPKDLFFKYSITKTTSIDARGKFISLIRDAIKQGATDIHIYPVHGKDAYKICFRVLGDLCDVDTIDYDMGRSLITVIINTAKIFTPSLRVDDVRSPQDARIELSKDDVGQDISIRLSIIWKPDMKSADVVMRLLYRVELSNITLESLGFMPKHAQMLKTVISRNRGIVIVTGATGSGKSKTINTLLSMIPRTRNVLTIEDPIEYILPNGRQFQIMEWEDTRKNEIVSTSFSDFSRAFKRHDPDVIFIGELRDKETVDTAMHLAKTSHLVFATLHAARATMIPELLIEDHGVSKEVIADNLIMGVNQVLVKRLCDKCKKKAILDKAPEWVKGLRYSNINDIYKLNKQYVYFANTDVRNTCSCTILSSNNRVVSKGYSGRTLIAEVYEFTPEKLTGGYSSYEMEKKVIASGNLLSDAIEKIQMGIIEIGAIQALL